MNRRILITIQKNTKLEVFLENGKLIRLQDSFSGENLLASQNVRRSICLLVGRGINECSQYLNLQKNRLELRSESCLLGGSDDYTQIYQVLKNRQVSNETNKKNEENQTQEKAPAPQSRKVINQQIQEAYDQICKEANQTALQIIQEDSYGISLMQQMKNIEALLSQQSYSFTQHPYAYRDFMNHLFRIHLRFQFISEFEIEVESEQQILAKFNTISAFSKQLRIVENIFPVLDLFFFSSLIAMYYQFKTPGKKINPSTTQKVLPIAFQVISTCQIVGEIGYDTIVSLKLGKLATGLVSVAQYAWQLYEGREYKKLLKGMFGIWTDLAGKVQLQKRKLELQEEVIFYMNYFLKTIEKEESVVVYVLMQIDYLLKMIINSKQLYTFLFSPANSSLLLQFISVIAIDDQESGIIDKIKEFFDLITYSVLARYSQLSIQLSLYQILKQQSPNNKTIEILIEIVEMSLMRRYLVEPKQNIRIVLESNDETQNLESKVKQVGSEFWKKYMSKNKFKQKISILHQVIKQQISKQEQQGQNDGQQKNKAIDIIQFEEQLQVNSKEIYIEPILNSEVEAVDTYQRFYKERQVSLAKQQQSSSNSILLQSQLSIDNTSQNQQFFDNQTTIEDDKEILALQVMQQCSQETANSDGIQDQEKLEGINSSNIKTVNGNKYEGYQWESNFFNSGTGKIYYSNKDVYTGESQYCKKHGQGIMKYVNGDIYDGSWIKDKKQGFATMTFITEGVYSGNWKDNKKNGQGKMEYLNGDVFEGIWNEDKREGEGKMKFQNGDEFEGIWQRNIKFGKGKMVYVNGDEYQGMWIDDKKDGEGNMKYINGDEYNGFWDRDRKHGQGTFKYENEDLYLGLWKEDKRHGDGKMKFSNGDIYVGAWQKDKKHGQGKMDYFNGDTYAGSWKEDKKFSKGCMRYANKEEYNGLWLKDKKNGQGTMLFQNGDSYEGQWKEDKRHGEGKMKYANGDAYKGLWNEDVKHGKGIQYTNQDVLIENWENGVLLKSK